MQSDVSAPASERKEAFSDSVTISIEMSRQFSVCAICGLPSADCALAAFNRGVHSGELQAGSLFAHIEYDRSVRSKQWNVGILSLIPYRGWATFGDAIRYATFGRQPAPNGREKLD